MSAFDRKKPPILSPQTIWFFLLVRPTYQCSFHSVTHNSSGIASFEMDILSLSMIWNGDLEWVWNGFCDLSEIYEIPNKIRFWKKENDYPKRSKQRILAAQISTIESNRKNETESNHEMFTIPTVLHVISLKKY